MVVDGHDLEHRRLRRVRRPRRHRRPDPHLRAVVVARQPPERDPLRSATPSTVKVLDIDRDRQRISLGLKQTQEDPWQRVVDTYNVGDELEGKVTKVVTFGAFVEILDGVEGLVHISELAQHHVENPREIIQPGDEVKVKILEIDSERRRLSLSIKRVEGQILPLRQLEPAEGAEGEVAAEPTSTTCRSWACRRTSSPARRPRRPRSRAAEVAAEPEASAPVEEPPSRGAGGRGACRAAVGGGAGRRRGAGCRRGACRCRGRAGGEAPAERGRRAARPRSRPPRPTRPPRTRRRRPDRLSRERRVPFVGLTGGIAAGKSTALAALARLGAATLSTDAVVHELYALRRGARPRRRALGRGCRARRRRRPRRGRRARLRLAGRAQLAGGRAVAARRRARRSPGASRRRAQEPPPPAAVVETPLLFEAGMDARLRRDDRGRRARGAARGARRRARARRASTSAPRASSRRTRRRARATYVVVNDGSVEQLETEAVGGPCKAEWMTVAHGTGPGRAPARQARRAPRAGGARRSRLLALLGIVGLGALVLRPLFTSAVRELTELPLRHEDTIRQQAQRQAPRPVADRRGDLRRVEVQRLDLVGRRAGADAAAAVDRATSSRRDRAGRASRRPTSRRRRSTSPTAAGTCATCSTATTATRCSRSRPTTAGWATSTDGWRKPARAASGLARRRHPVPRDARLRRSACSTRGASTADSTRTSSG